MTTYYFVANQSTVHIVGKLGGGVSVAVGVFGGWHVTCDIRHMKHDPWQIYFFSGNISLIYLSLLLLSVHVKRFSVASMQDLKKNTCTHIIRIKVSIWIKGTKMTKTTPMIAITTTITRTVTTTAGTAEKVKIY